MSTSLSYEIEWHRKPDQPWHRWKPLDGTYSEAVAELTQTRTWAASLDPSEGWSQAEFRLVRVHRTPTKD